MVKGCGVFGNGGTKLQFLHVRNTCNYYENRPLLILDPHIWV